MPTLSNLLSNQVLLTLCVKNKSIKFADLRNVSKGETEAASFISMSLCQKEYYECTRAQHLSGESTMHVLCMPF